MERQADSGIDLGPEGEALLDHLTRIVQAKLRGLGDEFAVAMFVATGKVNGFGGARANCACAGCCRQLAGIAGDVLASTGRAHVEQERAARAGARARGRVN